MDFTQTANSVANLQTADLATAQRLRELALQQLRESLRPGQQRLADWQAGPLAVSAVPGAGKSTGMAAAVASAIARYQLNPRRQAVVVTFTRSAVASIKTKIRQRLRELSLPQGGFAVYTLHGLALNIAISHPDLSGFDLENTTAVSPNQGHHLIRTCVEKWVSEHPRSYRQLLEAEPFDGEETERLRRQSVLRTEVLPALANAVIREAKSSGLLPADVHRISQIIAAELRDELDILAIAAGLYQQYETLLRSRGLIDYDDMILGAKKVLDHASTRLAWQSRIFAVFEDEAQDSTPLQTQLLEILATDPEHPTRLPNLVRVGDPNQAINSTFTPADPIFFRHFCQSCEQHNRLATIDQAGRSTQRIMDAANFALEWVNQRYCLQAQRAVAPAPYQPDPDDLPFRSQQIHPVPPDDPQPDANPVAAGDGLELYTPRDVFQTVALIAERVQDLFADNPQAQAAILVRENKQGQFITDLLNNPEANGIGVDLKALNIEVYDVGSRDRRSRIPTELLALLQWIERPHSPDYLKSALSVLVDRRLIPSLDLNALASLPERFLYPTPLDPPHTEPVRQAQHFCRGLLRARQALPPYQLILFLAMALKYDQAELATTDKLAERIVQQLFGSSSLSQTLAALSEIVSSERFEPVETEETESQYVRPRQLTIITMHKAKGLDWDYVFIPFLHEQTIPGRLWVPPQAKFLGEFSLAEVARAQIRAYLHQQFLEPLDPTSVLGQPITLPGIQAAWERAAHLKTAEEYRLLYVAMTRAKRLLWMSAAQKAPSSWNSPDYLEEKPPCPLLPALKQRFSVERVNGESPG
jgi:DNA helicase-2/ATP-dependent DNA helicase PcrA